MKALVVLIFNIVVINLVALAAQIVDGYNLLLVQLAVVWTIGMVVGFMIHKAFHPSNRELRLLKRLEDVARARLRYLHEHRPTQSMDDTGFTSPYLARIATILKELDHEKRRR